MIRGTLDQTGFALGKPIPCCPLLRNKTMGYRTDERPGLLHESNNIHYWCLRTQGPAGIDGEEACPSMCQGDRACFDAVGDPTAPIPFRFNRK